jgi:hypothetical protein
VRYENVFGAWLEATKHIGVNVRMLAEEELAKGKLNSGEFKVLILPICQALSGQEVAEIKKFAMNGGTVIADLKPGTCDEHGKLQSNALDDLFGVKISAAGEKKHVGDVALAPEKAATLPDLAKWRLPNVTVDELTAVTTGAPLARVGEVPVIIGNKYGKGHGIYLNFSIAPYMTLVEKRPRSPKDYEEGAPYRELMRTLLGVAGVTTTVVVEPEIALADISHFVSGPAEYVGILQDLPEDPMKYTRKEKSTPGAKLYNIKFARKSHLYDVREHRYVGYTDTVLMTGIAPARARLFAMMPYKIEDLALTGDTEARRGGDIKYNLSLQAGDAKALAPHVVRLDVYSPSGELVEFYSKNVLLTSGSAGGVIHLALNDDPGQWLLKAREVVSGRDATLRVVVSKPE